MERRISKKVNDFIHGFKNEIAEKIKKKIGVDITAKPIENTETTKTKVEEITEKSKKESVEKAKATSKENK